IPELILAGNGSSPLRNAETILHFDVMEGELLLPRGDSQSAYDDAVIENLLHLLTAPSTTLAFTQACDLIRQGCRRAHNALISAPSGYLGVPGHVAGRLRTGLGTIDSVRLAVISGEN